MSAVRPLLALGLLAALLAGCGGDDDSTAPASTISVTTITESTPTATTADEGETTTTNEEEAGDEGADTGRPQPGSGTGAANAVIAAAAVLTGDGTVDQACGSYVTETFIQTSYGGEENCIAARRGAALARSITVDDGDENATHIVVVPQGGPYDGAKVEIDLVVDDGGYRVDALKAHVPAGP